MIHIRVKPKTKKSHEVIDGLVTRSKTSHLSLYEEALRRGLPVSEAYTKAMIEEALREHDRR